MTANTTCRRPRSAFTMVEALISVLVGLTVMGVAYSFYEGSQKAGRKAMGITAAAQVAAQFFYALESDLANMVPADSASSSFETSNGETTGGVAGTRTLKFTRRTPGFSIKFDSGDITRRDGAGQYTRAITYLAKTKDGTKLFEISRLVGEPEMHNVEKETKFVGAYAEDVRFSAVKMNRGLGTQWFLRVSLLLVGDIDPEGVRAANASKPVVLTALFKIPVDRTQPPKEGVDRL